MTVDELIEKWWGLQGGAERSNLGPFITDLCAALDLPLPGPATGGKLGDYEYDGPVPRGSFRSLKATGFVDLYKRGCFVLEAKQSQIPEAQRAHPELFDPSDDAPQAPSGARYDQLMRDARAQAENYAKNLPGDHPPAPFILVCDIGRAFEIEFDYTGNGRGYGFFPDKQSYRIELPDLAKPEIARRLRNIWIAPDEENPRLRSAEVTSGIAKRLAQVSQYLEESNRHRAREAGAGFESQMIEETSLFLMRIIFCMFAEDIELLPKGRFQAFLEDTIENQTRFEQGLHDLWTKMNSKGGGFAWAVDDIVKYFNGGLFESDRTFVISNADRGELYQAARADWKRVEPAIFGTLLEQALTKEERAKLGAHYTPRPYVERLVQATIMDVLEPEWEAIIRPPRNGDGGPPEAGGVGAAISDPTPTLAAATAFHDRLAALRILDPACGTGNFLYVAMEALQQLEAKVIETIQTLGGEAQAKVDPHQFYGLELNPRAAKIAELVLWIGWLRFRIANDPGDIHDPVLDRTANINFGRHGGYDAVLAQTDIGEPDLEHPMIPAWPEADFIIGNPPFIGGKDLREKLGGAYAEALWTANPRVPASADFVMQWWDRAAHTLVAKQSPLRRFGFVTTNSITQEFSRRVIARYLTSPGAEKDQKLSLVYAIPDHPWTKASPDAAAVRIAMTVAEAGEHEGCFVEVTHEAKLDSDAPEIELRQKSDTIHASLAIGADARSAVALAANEGLSSRGVSLHGAGFILTPSQAAHLGLGRREGLNAHIRPYRNGRDLLGRPRGVIVIDLFGLSEREVRQRFPEIYQHLDQTVRAAREVQAKKSSTPDARAYLSTWWLHGKPRSELRPALEGLSRYIATVETAKHRTFEFLPSDVVPDNKIVVIASDDAFHLGVLSSAPHLRWTYANSGLIGVANFAAGHVYVKSKTFDPFPFPDPKPAQRKAIADLAEELDATRKAALAEMSGLTMTELYNLRDKLRSGTTLAKADQDRATAARAGIVNRLHEQLDAAVAAAYGWPADLPPSEIIARLVALNAERAAEEKAGKIRWLRPEYQEPRLGRAKPDKKRGTEEK